MSSHHEHRANLRPARAVGGGEPIRASISPPPVEPLVVVAAAIEDLALDVVLTADVELLRVFVKALQARALPLYEATCKEASDA